jgi:hypothetical protein
MKMNVRGNHETHGARIPVPDSQRGRRIEKMNRPEFLRETNLFIGIRFAMNFEEFENMARLYVVGALEDGEEEVFLETREDFGERAERVIAEFRQLNSVFALSLQPHPPHPETKRKLLRAIRESMQEASGE